MTEPVPASAPAPAAAAPAASKRPMLWSSMEALSMAVVSFVILAMLARYLDAATFGRAAVALGAVQIACSFVESFFHDAVVQRKDLQPAEVDAAHTAGVLVALLLVAGGGLLAWLAPPAADPAGPGVLELALWMAPSVLLYAWAAMSIAQLRRRLAMRQLALAMAGSRLLAGVVTIVALAQGAGVWAMVVNQNLAALALVALLAGGRAPAGRLTRDLSGAVRLAGYAAWTSASGLLNANLSRFFQVACGFFLPAAVVGQLSLALRIVDMLVSVMVTGVSRVTMSRLAATAHGGGDVADVFVQTTRRLSWVIVPMMVLMAVLAEPLVRFIGHGGWGAAAGLVAWFALAQALRSPLSLASTLFGALGRPRLGLLVTLAELGSLVLLMLLLRDPLAWAARVMIVTPVVWLLLRPFGIGAGALLRAVSAPFAAAALMGLLLHLGLPWLTAMALPPLVTLMVGGAAGAALYAALAGLLTGLRRLASAARPALAQGVRPS